jgi:acyl-CoA thioesterase FadM
MGERARHIEPVTVRWGDVDSMGHVNNAKYFTY